MRFKQQNKSTKCPCGSRRKYKNCCKKKDDLAKSFIALGEKLRNGELPFRAEIISENGEPASMKVTSASIDTGNGVKTLFEDEITLSTGSAGGDTVEKSRAQITIPINQHEKPQVITSGNASVNNNAEPYKITIPENPKKLKIKSNSGLFAIIRVAKQGDTGVDYLDVLFGTKGIKEKLDQEGNKNRAHIAFYPDGNSKFIRLSGYKCELNNVMNYDPKGKQITPSALEIHSKLHSESILLEFEFIASKKEVVLVRAAFNEQT